MKTILISNYGDFRVTRFVSMEVSTQSICVTSMVWWVACLAANPWPRVQVPALAVSNQLTQLFFLFICVS